MGLEDDAFTGPAAKEELMSVFKESGCCDGLSEAELEAVWNTALADTRGAVCVQAFQRALNELLEAKSG